jgi:Peptidase family C25
VAAELIFLNGVDATTGEYLPGPREVDDIVELARGEVPQAGTWLTQLAQRLRQKHLGLPYDVDSLNVDDAGWAVVYATDEAPEVRTRVADLVDHRRGPRTKELEYRPGESVPDWLTRHRVSRGNVDPDHVPFYLLLIGSPERIPFEFQFDLDAEYCVGRLDFGDADDYGHYARSVIAYETGDAEPRADSAVFLGTKHPGDGATTLTAEKLVPPLAAKVPKRFEAQVHLGDDATKERLVRVVSGADGLPTLLFTATHGLAWPLGDPGQLEKQGSLLCQGWVPGTRTRPEHYFGSSDVAPTSALHGLVVFHFACYSAGTPQYNDFSKPGVAPPMIAERPFVAGLPQRLLAEPNGGALAVIGHVERAWTCSVATAGAGAQIRPFINALGSVLVGKPVGYAMKDFNERYATLSVDLTTKLRQLSRNATLPMVDLARDWLERTDARNYVVLGDPAVRLRSSVGPASGAVQR